MEPNRNILLIRLKSIGDILFTLPAVHRVRAAYPHAKISFLISREHAPILEGFREVDTVITLDRSRFRGLKPKAVAEETFSLWRALRRERFSLAIDLQGYGETALMTWGTGAPQRWGTVYRASRQWAYTRGVRRDPAPHPAEGHLTMLAECGLPPIPARNQFTLPAGPIELARQFFTQAGLDPARPTLFVQPFTSSTEKDWPLDRYLVIGRRWRERRVQVLFGGGPAERLALEPALQAGFPVSAGAPLLVSAALMHLSTIVLGGETGLPHLAVALGKRVIELMGGGTGPGRGYPFQHREWAVASPTGCPMASIDADAVDAACIRAFADLGWNAGMRNPNAER